MHTERVEITIIIDDTYETDDVLPAVQSLGIEGCTNNRTVRMIIGYLAITDDYSSVLSRLRELPGVTWAGDAIVVKTIE